MFIKRHYKKELMDDFSIVDQRIDEALNELKLINKYLGGFSTSYSGLKYFRKKEGTYTLKILDIGSGSGDVLESMRSKETEIKIFYLDKNKRACAIINANHSEVNTNPINGDVIHLPLKHNSIDIVHTSLFLHHFSENEITNILTSSLIIAKRGIIINDLRRSVIALAAIKLLLIFFSKSTFVKNDAPLSIKKGFIKSDLTTILNNLNIRNYLIKRKWAFRWLVVIPVSGNENN